MYAQSTVIRVPLGKMERMREIIRRDYLPKIEGRAGFVTAFLLEQVDDPDRAELLVLWESQAAVEHFNSTGLLEATVHGLAAYLPDVQVQRQSYALTVSAGALLHEMEAMPPAAVQP
ncbi:MAG: antibiotic biosynthesis monooxygenase, partial [Chloroflexota bacterium]